MEGSFTSQQASLQPKLTIYQNILLKRFQDIVELAPTDNIDRQTAATQSYQIQVHTAAIVKTAEDLLTLTRALKEAWLFGPLGKDDAPDTSEETQVNADAAYIGQWLKDKIREAEVGEVAEKE